MMHEQISIGGGGDNFGPRCINHVETSTSYNIIIIIIDLYDILLYNKY